MFTLSIMSSIEDALRTLMLDLCDMVYRLIAFCFNVFYNLGRANLLKDEAVQTIVKKVGLILGVFMVFRVTFAFIQYIVDPDTMKDKNKGAATIIKRVLITIILLGSTNYLFNFAFEIQNKVLDSRILEKVILGQDDANDLKNFGGNLSGTVFTTFYRMNPREHTDAKYKNCKNLVENRLKTSIKSQGGRLSLAYVCLVERVDYEDALIKDISDINEEAAKSQYVVDFPGGGALALLAGIMVLYTIFIFTFQVGIRLIQIAYLQIISPIPIAMYITPKGDEKLKKWAQQCLTTYLDFFIRVAIIYFAVFLIEVITNNNNISSLAGNDVTYNVYVVFIMIVATLTFAKKIPNLLKEIFPSFGGAAAFDYGLSFKKQVVEPLKSAYNSPLGWGLKLGKAGAVGAIGTVDRKIHSLPKPRNKFQQKLDKLMPGRAEYIKNKSQGMVDSRDREKLYNEGKTIFDKYNGDLKDKNGKLKSGVFKNTAFAETWQKVADAKSEQKNYNAKLVQVQGMVNRGEITTDSEIYKTALKNANAADSRLEAAKKTHENNRKIYTDDARIEDSFSYYKDLQSADPADSMVVDEAIRQREEEQKSQQEEAKRKQQEEEQKRQQERNIITEEHIQSQPRQETTSQENIQEEYSKLINQYNSETDPNKKAAIRKQIDDFERKH